MSRIRRFSIGNPINTEAVVQNLPEAKGEFPYFTRIQSTESSGINLQETMEQKDYLLYPLEPETRIYGLGENIRGINKRGWIYESNCTDDPNHTEDRRSLYGAHNFFVVDGQETFGVFLDYPGKLTLDMGYERMDELRITPEDWNLDLYILEGDSIREIVKAFRQLIGRSYIPPRWAFGFGQSRWGYQSAEDIREVVKGYRDHGIPLDSVYLDIDYMEDFKDFTVNQERFPDFRKFVEEMKQEHIHLVPIIDAGVKTEQGYDVYEEGLEHGYFCKDETGKEFTGAVWPGKVHFPDVLNREARNWFGRKYQFLLEQGIEGFWNDMNEPAIFYSREGIEELKETIKRYVQEDMETIPVWELEGLVTGIANNPEDYRRFYHNVGGRMIRHDKVHNLFGYNMTRAAAEAFDRIVPDKRLLMFSRSSYIGMHRYGGIWTGDNRSWWSHILLNLKMMPSLNMCGFLYTGADLGGFDNDATRDLVLRWMALGVFTPLMRNHSAQGTRRQEAYQFGDTEDFRGIVETRYRLLPYLYSEYMKAALNDDMYFRPLAFVYPEDSFAAGVEDQMMLGGEAMIAPVYTQNAKGRYVYLPEDMLFVKFAKDGAYTEELLTQGHHYVEIAVNEVPFFIRKGRCIPLAEAAECMEKLDTANLKMIGFEHAEYTLYEDDGIGKDYENPANYRVLRCD